MTQWNIIGVALRQNVWSVINDKISQIRTKTGPKNTDSADSEWPTARFPKKIHKELYTLTQRTSTSRKLALIPTPNYDIYCPNIIPWGN